MESVLHLDPSHMVSTCEYNLHVSTWTTGIWDDDPTDVLFMVPYILKNTYLVSLAIHLAKKNILS